MITCELLINRCWNKHTQSPEYPPTHDLPSHLSPAAVFHHPPVFVRFFFICFVFFQGHCNILGFNRPEINLQHKGNQYPRTELLPPVWVQIIRFTAKWRTITIKANLLWWNLVVANWHNCYMCHTHHRKRRYAHVDIKTMTSSPYVWCFLICWEQISDEERSTYVSVEWNDFPESNRSAHSASLNIAHIELNTSYSDKSHMVTLF